MPDLVANFSLPKWSTHALNAGKEGINLFKTKLLNIEGSYRYFSEVHTENVEQLKLDFDVRLPHLQRFTFLLFTIYQLTNAVFCAFGWSIRYVMVLRDNYLGSFTHFQTLYEYLDKRRRNLPVGDPLILKYRPGHVRLLETSLHIGLS